MKGEEKKCVGSVLLNTNFNKGGERNMNELFLIENFNNATSLCITSCYTFTGAGKARLRIRRGWRRRKR